MKMLVDEVLEHMNKIKITFLFFVVLIALSFIANNCFANNLAISDFGVYATNESANTITFTCDVSWENSWKSTESNDAVWVFVKYSTDGGASWSHASMSASGTDPYGFNSPTGFEMIVPDDENGFFLQRTDLSSGNITAEGTRFVWDYSQDGLSDEVAMAANTVTKIYGIEMVYVPEGPFYAGDGNSSSSYKFQQGSADNDPWYITSEDAINTTGGASDGFYYQNSGAASGESATGSEFLIRTSFPKGFQGFYLMKYELTEGQWVAFFNTLSPGEKSNRDITASTVGGKNSDSIVNRNTVSWDSTNVLSDATTTRPDRAVTYISWPDLLAYADWAALRPVTELEYEKAARGKDITPTVNEYAWGNTTLNGAGAGEIYPAAGDEDGTEQISDGGANINNNSLSWSSGDGRVGGDAEAQVGPVRAGIFAENSTTRTTSGAGYYGNMELSGNLSEMVVSVGKDEGRQYLGTHGDGQLSSVTSYEGNATNPDWPGINSTDSAYGVTNTAGYGYRGGDFNSSSVVYQASDRSNASKDPDTEGKYQRYDASFGIFNGGRLGRTTP